MTTHADTIHDQIADEAAADRKRPSFTWHEDTYGEDAPGRAEAAGWDR